MQGPPSHHASPRISPAPELSEKAPEPALVSGDAVAPVTVESAPVAVPPVPAPASTPAAEEPKKPTRETLREDVRRRLMDRLFCRCALYFNSPLWYLMFCFCFLHLQRENRFRYQYFRACHDSRIQ